MSDEDKKNTPSHKTMNVFVEKYISTYLGSFSLFRSYSIRNSAYLNVCLSSSDKQWPR